MFTWRSQWAAATELEFLLYRRLVFASRDPKVSPRLRMELV